MEHEDHARPEAQSFEFLEYKDVQAYFADLNIELLRGGHILNDKYYSFQLLRNYFPQLHHYYQSLYGLELIEESQGDITYFYLDFSDESKGKHGDPSNYRDLPESQTVFGITLLNLYYDRYFEHPKEITMSDLKHEFLESENSVLYRRLWFGEVRDDYSKKEWMPVIKSINATLRYFKQLGWIESQQTEDDEDEEVKFVIKESILRFQKLYEKEIAEFEAFVESYLAQKQ